MDLTYQQRRANRRVAEGLCCRCGKNALASLTMCQPCLDEHKDLLRSVRATRRETGLCTVCGQLPPEPGKVRCADCGRKGNASNASLVAVRRVAGHCIRCGYDGPLKTRTRCVSCTESDNLKRNARSHGLTVDEYQEMIARGCWICGSEENLQIDHDHSCCDYVANGYRRSQSCAGCTRGALCGQHNSIAAGLESPEALRVLEYLFSSSVPSGAPLFGYIRKLRGEEADTGGTG